MAATVKKEYVLKVMEEQSLPFFVVTDGKDTIGLNDTEHNIDVAVRSLSDLIDNVEDGFVVVKLSDTSRKDKGAKGGRNYYNYEFKLNLKKSQEAPGAVGINATILELIKTNNDLMRKIEQQEANNKIKDLERTIGEIKEEKPDMMEKWMPLLTTYLTGTAHKENKVGIAGHGDEPIETTLISVKEKIRLALVRLQKVDKNLPDTLTMLADFAEQQPEKYLSFIPIIKTQL